MKSSTIAAGQAFGAADFYAIVQPPESCFFPLRLLSCRAAVHPLVLMGIKAVCCLAAETEASEPSFWQTLQTTTHIA
jgi:hypothetical protein